MPAAASSARRTASVSMSSGAPCIRMRITGDALAAWDRHGARAVHVQIAGHPGRHEPTGGDIDWPGFFARLDADGYRGWVSAEYNPRCTTAAGLGWLPKAG